MDSQPLHQDNTLGATNTTPHQEHKKTCTRKSPCQSQGCTYCHTPTSHIRNLDANLDSSNASLTPPTTINLHRPPADQPILLLTSAFHNAIQTNNVYELEEIDHLYKNTMKSNLDFLRYDRSDLFDLHLTAVNLLDSHTAANTLLPPSSLLTEEPQITIILLLSPASSLLRSPLTPGVVNLMISTSG